MGKIQPQGHCTLPAQSESIYKWSYSGPPSHPSPRQGAHLSRSSSAFIPGVRVPHSESCRWRGGPIARQ